MKQWTCYYYKMMHDRDLNAARNLANYAVRSTVNVCGCNSSDCMNISVLMKQKVNTK